MRIGKEGNSMYTTRCPAYDIDLDLPEEERWTEVIKKDKQAARKVAKESMFELSSTVKVLMKPGGWVFKKLYGLFGGLYVKEIESWAGALGVSAGEAALLNCTYELSHAGEINNIFGCTAGIRWITGLGMVHLRSMDWPLTSIGNATRLFRFHRGDRMFLSVGITGFVGVLSGMVPGGYSVTINWAPPEGVPRFDFGPAFLLREVLQDCDTYDEAVYSLSETKLATPVFFTVCGTRKGEGCVIERTRESAFVRELSKGVIAQANHHVAPCFVSRNEGMDHPYDDEASETSLDDSKARAAKMSSELGKIKRAESLAQASKPLRLSPVRNDLSYQQMAFVPKSGEVRVYRWAE